jgi:hypothetical protein
MIQSIPYTAAIIMAIISGFSRIPSQLITRMTAPPVVISPTGSPTAGSETHSTN